MNGRVLLGAIITVLSVGLVAQTATAQSTEITPAEKSLLLKAHLEMQMASDQQMIAATTSGACQQGTTSCLLNEVETAILLAQDIQSGKFQIQDCQVGGLLDSTAAAVTGYSTKASLGTRNTITVISAAIPVAYYDCNLTTAPKLTGQYADVGTALNEIANYLGNHKPQTTDCSNLFTQLSVLSNAPTFSQLVTLGECLYANLGQAPGLVFSPSVNQLDPVYKNLSLTVGTVAEPPSFTSADTATQSAKEKSSLNNQQTAADYRVSRCKFIQHLVAFDSTVAGLLNTNQAGQKKSIALLDFLIPIVGGCAKQGIGAPGANSGLTPPLSH
jgi:hypothetical protein